jgi:hypothetical protein
VLEDHGDWQLVEYYHGNTAEVISRYRAFRDRIEPISFRVIADVGIAFVAMAMILPAMLLANLINRVQRWVRRRTRPRG